LGEAHGYANAALRETGSVPVLQPVSASYSGGVVTVQFDVPVEPLQWDTTTVASQTDYGFTVESDSGAETITSVDLGGDGTSVEITLSGTPGANLRARYGFDTQYGNLRDSETRTSVYDGETLANWLVHSEIAVS
jgi:hypothetical protein